MKSLFGQSANYAVMAIMAAAAVFGVWLLRSGDGLGTAADSLGPQNNTARATADLLHSASSPEGAEQSSESGSRGDSEPTNAPADEFAEPGSNHYEPIPVPGDFAGIVERDGRLSEFHERLEREPEDPGWALPLELELEGFLNERLDPALIAVKLIECRSDSCEILAVGYGEDATKEWFEMFRALHESGIVEKWFETEEPGQFNGGCGGVELAPGVAGLICEFSRASPQPTEEDAATAGPFSLTAPYPDGIEFTPVPVPDDFVSLYETNAEVYEFHRALQAETIDHSWAPFVESQIAEHFFGAPEFESVNYHHLECRMTRCEVQLTISDPSTAIAWTLELKDFHSQPWNDLEFTIYNVPADDDLMRILWLLRRKNSN